MVQIMKNVILIVGLPGSGKTTLAIHKYVPEGYVLVDDPKDLEPIYNAVYNHDKVVVTDPHLVRASVRTDAYRLLHRLGCEVTCVYFENDLARCLENVKLRGNEPINVEIMSRFYDVPEGVVLLPVWRGSDP